MLWAEEMAQAQVQGGVGMRHFSEARYPIYHPSSMVLPARSLPLVYLWA